MIYVIILNACSSKKSLVSLMKYANHNAQLSMELWDP